MLSFVPDPQFPCHGPEWDTQMVGSLEMAPTLLQGGPYHKLAGAGLRVSKTACLYLFSKAFSPLENKLKCLLLHEAFSNVLPFLSILQLLAH